MNIYEEIAEKLKTSTFYVTTVLEGAECGKKQISEAEETQESEDGNRIFCERIGGSPKLVICGAGHVSVPIIRMGKMLGFSVTVIEDRPMFANHARTAKADCVLCEPFEEALKKIDSDEDTYFIIVTRGHRYDRICLETILKKRRAYVGMMGSKRRVFIVKEQLEEKGIQRETLEQVHTPIGLKIGAETPEEIAVSILAEIIREKSVRKQSQGYPEELMEGILDKERNGEKKILATIISRKGSAPRKTGTKMLIQEDGTLIGSIGGGCAESKIIQKALHMMRQGEKFQICKSDMTAKEAEDDGMVCGGVIEVMLERV